MLQRDMIIIGGGSAGMAAAVSAYETGVKDVLILERNHELGGILQQCIHNGFGLHTFQKELSGPAYAQRWIEFVKEKQIDVRLDTTVVSVQENGIVTYENAQEGYVEVQAKTVVFASGCYERNRGAIQIPGKRLPGVYCAGTAQKYLNIENILVGKKVLILGSGDIGLIMARRMTLEGAKVEAVVELMPYSNGLTRNIVQCLQDYDIPLYLSHTVIDIQGKDHVEKVVIAQVDEQRQPIKGTEKSFAVDTLLLSVGLIPENDLGKEMGMELDVRTKGAVVDEYYETSIPHMYACGNALHVHDIVDFVTLEAKEAGKQAALDVLQTKGKKTRQAVAAKDGIGYVLPQKIAVEVKQDITFSMRVKAPMKQVMLRAVAYDGTLIKEVKKQVVLPAEMIRLTIKKEELQNVHEGMYMEVKPCV